MNNCTCETCEFFMGPVEYLENLVDGWSGTDVKKDGFCCLNPIPRKVRRIYRCSHHKANPTDPPTHTTAEEMQ